MRVRRIGAGLLATGVSGALALALVLGVVVGPMTFTGSVSLPSEPPPEPEVSTHEPGLRVLALAFPSADLPGLLEAIENPGGAIRQLEPADDFVRVCGADTGVWDMVVAQFPDEETAVEQEAVLARLPGVRGVYRNHWVQPAGLPTGVPSAGDPDYPKQWPLENTGQPAGDNATPGRPGEDIKAQGAWSRGATGEGVVVAVLDQGMDIAHPDLAPNVWVNEDEIPANGVDDDANGWVDDVNGWSFATGSPNIRPMDHGTNVAGIIAAAGGNGVGIRGVAPRAKLMPVDFVSFDLIRGSEVGALGAFAYAIANGADVINNSWGTPVVVGGPGNPIIHLAVQCAAARDIPIAWAAGNVWFLPEAWPAYVPAQNVLITAGFRNDGCVDHRFNRTAAIIDVLAPSTDVWTTDPGATYAWFTGTSAATPHTAGVLALLRQLHPDVPAEQLVLAVRNGARRPVPTPWSRSMGLLSADGALAALANNLLPAEPVEFDLERLLDCEQLMLHEWFPFAVPPPD